MQCGFDNRINTHFVNTKFSGDTGKVERIEVRNGNLKPGGLAACPCSIRSGHTGIPLRLQISSKVGSEVKTITDILDTINIL